jgi:methionyl aminopeptidase
MSRHSSVKTAAEIEIVREAAEISMRILKQLVDATKIGVTPLEINDLAGKLCEQNGVKPSFLGVDNGETKFPGNMCVCVNSEILHAIPRDTRKFQEGDLIKLDFGIVHKGFNTDHCVTVGLGNLSEADVSLLKIGKIAVESAIPQAKPGNTTGDLGYVMQSIAELSGYNVLSGFVGHGIGRSLHEYPQVPAYGEPHTGSKLEAGMVICMEAQVVAGRDETRTAEDGWTVITRDGANGVMFEYMVLITEDEPEILTDTREWPILKD